MKKKFIFLIFPLLLVSCKDDFLDTTNPNSPNLKNILSDPTDWEAFIAKQFVTIWHATQSNNAAVVMGAMADVITSSWINLGIHYYSSEPRVEIWNRDGSSFVEFSWYENYKVIGSINDILRLLNENPETVIENDQGDNIVAKLRSVSLFLRGMAYGNLALKYDQVIFVDEDSDLANLSSQDYEDYHVIVDKAIMDLENAISIALTAPEFHIEYYNGAVLSKPEYLQLIRTLQAKYKLHLSRDADENLNNDWSQILNYARQGLDFDFAVIGDGFNLWYDDYKLSISGMPNSFLRIDYRVIAAMAENTPSRFPEDPDLIPLPEPVAIDQRLISDMRYREDVNFPSNRGYYHWSHYIHKRYDYHWLTGSGAMPWILKAENDLMIAEALIRTGGDRQEAADLINITRVGRGQMTELTGQDNDQVLLDAIMHERWVELLGTNGGQPFYDRRRLPDDDGSFDPYSGLQPGTPSQFPVPARELNVLGLDIYTFGGT